MFLGNCMKCTLTKAAQDWAGGTGEGGAEGGREASGTRPPRCTHWRMRLSSGRGQGFLQKAKTGPEEKGKLEDRRGQLCAAMRGKAECGSDLNALMRRAAALRPLVFSQGPVSRSSPPSVWSRGAAPLFLLFPPEKETTSARNAELVTPMVTGPIYYML